MMRKEIVMKMLLEKLKAAFGTGVPDYKVSVREEDGSIKVIERENSSVWFYAKYDDEIESFVYAGGGIDSSILRTLVEIEDAIAEEYPCPEETVVYEVFMNSKDYPNTYDMWGVYLTIEKAISTMHELKRKNPNIEYYIQKKTIIKERVIECDSVIDKMVEYFDDSGNSLGEYKVITFENEEQALEYINKDNPFD